MLKKCLNVESKPDNNAQSQVFLPAKSKSSICLLIYLGLIFCFVFLFYCAETGNQDSERAK